MQRTCYNLFSAIILFTCLYGCTKGQTIPEIKYQILHSYTEYPDSSFFKEISCMYYEDGKLYTFDKSRGDVGIWGTESNIFYTVGKIGEGPAEASYPVGFYVQEDTISILDGGSLSLKHHTKNGFIKSTQTQSASDNRFFIDKDTIYMSAISDSSCYAKFNKNWERTNINEIKTGGTFFQIVKDRGMNYVRNQRHLVKGKDCFYAISSNYPIIEQYDLHSNSLLESYDLSNVEFIHKTLDYIKENTKSEKNVFIFIKDIYWNNDNLYILCANWENGYHVNTILVINDTEAMKPIHTIKLPDEIYTTIAINNDEIFAGNYTRCSIDMYHIVK